MGTFEIEVWVMVDEDGDYAVGVDEEMARDAFEENVGGCQPNRLVKIVLTVPAIEPVVLWGDIPPQPTEGAALRINPVEELVRLEEAGKVFVVKPVEDRQ